MPLVVSWKKLNENAVVPERKTPGAAGFDLSCLEAFELQPGQRKAIETGLACSLHMQTVGLIRPRSGLAVNHGIDTLAGTVDEDYRGEIKVVLINHGDEPVSFEAGERIAQMIVTGYGSTCELVDELPESMRADAGFGSTGTD